MPLTIGVHELEVRPDAVRGSVGDEVLQELEALGFVGVRRTGYLDPSFIFRHVAHPLLLHNFPSNNPAKGEAINLDRRSWDSQSGRFILILYTIGALAVAKKDFDTRYVIGCHRT